MSSNDIKVSIDERRIGNAAGDAVASELKGEFRQLRNKLDQTNEAVRGLEDRIQTLERRIEQIEQAKARAQRRATEDLKDELEKQVTEKREEYQRRLDDILSDYRGSIERLKERFLGSISGSSEQFEQLEAEFETLAEDRADCREAAAAVADGHAKNYGDRLETIIEARNEFLTAIDDFLTDREGTAETIDSLQTRIPEIDDAARIQVPFWVVGVRTNGSEEIRVYPIRDRTTPDTKPTRADPYVPHLSDHEVHDYADMTDSVREYVAQDAVRDNLAHGDGEFADPGFLRQRGDVRDRFVEGLREFELDDRAVGGDTAAESTDRSTERAAVTTDD